MKSKMSLFTVLAILALVFPLTVLAGPSEPGSLPKTEPTLSESVEAALSAFDGKNTDQFAVSGTAFLVLDREQDIVTRFYGQAYSAWKPGGDIYFVTCEGSICLAGGWNVLWLSSDGGTSWKPVLQFNDTKNPLCFKYGIKAEGGFNDVYLDADGKTIAASVANFVTGTGDVFWSYDGGTSWEPGPRGLAGIITGLELIDGQLWAIDGTDAYKLTHHYEHPGELEPASTSWEKVQLGLAGDGSCLYVPDLAIWACSDRDSSYKSFVLVPDVLRDQKVYVPNWDRTSEKGDCLILTSYQGMVGTDRCGICTVREVRPDRQKTNWSNWKCSEFERSDPDVPVEVRFLDEVGGYPLAATSAGLKWAVQP
jgi:hypothetical protein